MKRSLANILRKPYLVERQSEVGFLENDVIRLKYQETTTGRNVCQKNSILRYCFVYQRDLRYVFGPFHFNDLNISVSEHFT